MANSYQFHWSKILLLRSSGFPCLLFLPPVPAASLQHLRRATKSHRAPSPVPLAQAGKRQAILLKQTLSPAHHGCRWRNSLNLERGVCSYAYSFSHLMRPKHGLRYQANRLMVAYKNCIHSGTPVCGRLLVTLLGINSSCSNFGLILSEAKWFFNKRQWRETKYSWNAGTKTNGGSFKTNRDGR